MTNLRILAKSRKKLREGDYFVLQILPQEYHWGRVINTRARVFLNVDCNLIYIYKNTTLAKSSIPLLMKENLLIPPCLINRLPWSRGYFEAVGNAPLTCKDVFHQHCFKDFSRYVNEYRQKLPARTEPYGEFGLYSFRTVDDAVSEALGIPLAKDDEN